MRLPLRAACGLVFVVIICSSAARAATPAANSAEAAKLVRAALEAELRGDSQTRAQSLHDALEADPEYAPARWQSGFVQFEKQWLTIDEVPARTAGDERLAAYRQKRNALIDTADNQRELARWCDKQQLKAQSRVHWTKVLEFDARDEEAIRAIGLKLHDGRLMTREEIERQRAWAGRQLRATREWQPQFVKWRQAFEQEDATGVAAANQGLRHLDDPAALPAIVATFSANGDTPKQLQRNRLLVETLSRFPERIATEALLQLAVVSESLQLRQIAAEALRSRPPITFVPDLVAALPVESSLETSHVTLATAGGVVSAFETIERTPSENNAVRRVILDSHYISAHHLQSTQHFLTATSYQRALVASQELERQLHVAHQADQNAKAERRRRLQAALLASTGFKEVEGKKAWLIQLAKHTETYLPAEFPINGRRDLIVAELVTVTAVRGSCFPAGTSIQLNTGLTPVEQILPGDQVLSQDLESGELLFKTVGHVTIRPAVPLVEIGLDGETILATRGHPFWVDGEGWRMAKQLVVGQLLHTPNGSVVIEHLGEKPPQEAYNLVVSDFGTYFVGESQVLVHDNLPLVETAVRIPGLAARPNP